MKESNAVGATTKISGSEKKWKMYRKWKSEQTERTEFDPLFLFESNNER